MRRVPRCVAPGLLAVAVGAIWGCGTTDVPVLRLVGGTDAGSFDATSPVTDARVEDARVEAAPAPEAGQGYCQGTGPPDLVATSDAGPSPPICPDDLAKRAFRYALCVCNNYTSTQALVTDAFDGAQGPYDMTKATTGGSVGVNGELHPGPMKINGSLWASNTTTDITTTTMMQVSGELHAGGEMHPASLFVGADAWMLSGIQTQPPGDVTVQGTLHIPATAPRSVTGTFTTGAIDTTTPFTVPTACDCNPTDLVDIAGVVRTYEDEAQNDDEALGISPTMLQNVASDAGIQALPCGRIFLSGISGNAPIHLTTAPGRVAIFVQGDLLATDFQIDVPAGSELDLFIGGSVTVSGSFLVGDSTNPARARTYVGGSTVNLQGAATLAGNLYAPLAMMTLGGTATTTLYGSIFTSGLTSGSDLTIHYDEAILSPSSACATPHSCSTCNDCNGQACNSLQCGVCADSTQCCAPLVCNAGSCVANVTPR